MPTIETLLQYLYDGNILGFIQAIYISAFQSADLFYGLLSSLFFIPLYIRTHSIVFLSIIWILVGSLFIVAMPLISGLGLLFMVLGFGGVLFKAYISLRG